MPELAVRPLRPEDIPRIVDYWTKATAEDLRRMGADPAKIPAKEQLTASLLRLCATPESELPNFYSVWLVDGRAVGYSSLKNIVHGDRGEMHLHMWDDSLRGKGYGAVLFCLSAVDFYTRFRLKDVICEPSSSNPMPNRMLQRIGFPLVKTYVGASSELSMVCELNRYQIDRAIAERYLAGRNTGAV
jgi:RimJ/RimL family protein N-acetyltransferase